MRPATSVRAQNPDGESNSSAGTPTSTAKRNRFWRRLAVVLGLVATACALAFPFLPVVQDTAKIVWPVNGDTTQVNAPLTGYWAQDLQVHIPCETVRGLDARTQGEATLFSTVPSARTENGAGMQLRVNDGLLTANNRGQQVARQPLPAEGCDVHFSSDANKTSLTVGGTEVYQESGDVRPRVLGIYTAITSEDSASGLSAEITTDTRYQSSATGLKITVGIVGVLAIIGCLIAVNRLDTGVARRAPRWAPVGWWRLTGRDIAVIVALGAWVFIGPVTSDDGYILSMARVTEDAGFLANYHRWFGVAEAPFGWFYHVYQAMAHVSVVAPWIRLPSFLLGVISWLLITREVMPRLGKEVRRSRAAGWAAATVFLVWWMPYNNGVRPEPVAAVGSLLAICAVERALVTRRMLPVCLGLLAAAFTLAATPTGLIAVAPFIVAGRPLFQLFRQRAKEGWSHVFAPIFASGVVVLFAIFFDQTWATVSEATRLRNEVGPSLSWFQELLRYQQLFSSTVDGSASRRFPVLLLLLCVGACVVVLLRKGRIPGAALGPSRRLIGTVALFFLLMALTPTKWTHHFGAFAAVGAAMAALTALATSGSALRSKRNRAAFVSGLLVVAALAATGPNAYWFVSAIGVPWWNMPPEILGIRLSTLLLFAAAIAAVIAFLENIKAQRPDLPGPLPERRGLALWRGSLAIVVICGLVAITEFGSMAKAIHKQRESYSLGAANIAHLFGKNCGLGDYVMVERDPVSSMLVPLPPGEQRTVADAETPGRPGSLPSRQEGNEPTQVGFHDRPMVSGDPIAGPPHGFTPDSVPMWSSYNETANPTGRLRSEWYGIGERPEGGQLVTAVRSPVGKATKVAVQYGEPTPEGIKIVRSTPVLEPGAGTDEWVDVRLNLDEAPENATAARIVAEDNDLTQEGWVAATAPRVPTFTTLTERVGDEPVYMDWPTSFVYPCLNPMKVTDGIAEVPAYHITANELATEGDWADNKAGGPNGILEELANQPEVPSYLKGAPGQIWGTLEEVEPYTEGNAPTVVRGQEVRPGWWSPGPGPQQPDGSQPTR
ncbi:arabinosyltransferase C [Prauserella marina]|uniref:Arabinosyltransferase C n=1 Tax=Prauserella marina TaxID=530584 RepID=A0A1G6LUU0_9PSEU|nr:arabinosyltransferase domain-containing protein [Prauserella marina]PWV85739.1 4-amino-4-deoxy-L-arabinose transferase-like glycosyltransferase [Prauserella marina]SDC46857.1 arabinosyltransferase C [Prauserella marina]